MRAQFCYVVLHVVLFERASTAGLGYGANVVERDSYPWPGLLYAVLAAAYEITY